MDVSVPAGVVDGAVLRLAGLGDAGRNGAPRGDLYLKLQVTVSQWRACAQLIVSSFKET